MVTEKDLLLLCECIQSKHGDEEKALLELKKIEAQTVELMEIHIFEQEKNQQIFVVASKERLPQETNQACLEQVREYIHQHICHNEDFQEGVVTGIGVGGLYAASIASDLEMEGIVFGAPMTKTITGCVTNYVGENEPITMNSEHIVFVKQIPLEDCFDQSRSETFMFDAQGHVIKSSQSMYSKFCTWFYHTEVNIDEHVWNLFFSDSARNETLIEKQIYTVLLKADVLTQASIKKSLKDVIRHIQMTINQCKQTLHLLYMPIDHMKYETLEDYVCEIAEVLAKEIAMIVEHNYKSVESILAGVSLLTVGKKDIDFENLGEAFILALENLLDNEKVSIYETLKQEKETIIQAYFRFPEKQIIH